MEGATRKSSLLKDKARKIWEICCSIEVSQTDHARKHHQTQPQTAIVDVGAGY